LFDMKPPLDAGLHRFAFPTSIKAIGSTLSALWLGLAPIPAPRLEFWNSNIVSSMPVQALLGTVLLVLAIGVLRRWPLLLGVYLVGTGMILVLSHARQVGGVRHTGHLYLVLMLCCWLPMYFPPAETRSPVREKSARGCLDRRSTRLVTGWLLLHSLVGMFATV